MLSLAVLGWEGYNLIMIDDLCNMWDGNLFSDMVIRKSSRMDGFDGGMLPDFWVDVFWWKVKIGGIGLC